MFRNALIIGFALALSATGLAAAQGSTARVRVLHLAQDVQPVSVMLDGQTAASGLRYLGASDYLETAATTKVLALAPSGTQTIDPALSVDLNLTAGQSYTVAEIGANGVQGRLLTDDRSAIPAGKARVRFFHASPDAPSVDVELVNGPTLFEGVGFGRASEYQLVDAGSYNLRVVANGNNVVFVELPNTALQAGQVYDIVAAGRLAALTAQIYSAPAETVAAVPPRMPVTADGGQAGQLGWLLGLAIMLIGGGLAVRRRVSR